MVAYLMKRYATLTLHAGVAGMLQATCVLAVAQVLADPTRPPGSLSSPESQSDEAPSAAASGPVLQSVLISPTRRIAVISGETVTVGEKIGEARVTKILETEVVLREGTQLQTLKLYPAIEKMSPSAKASDSHKADRKP